MKHILLTFLFTVLFSSTSQAGFFLEPGLGYNMQSYENNKDATDKGTLNGIGLSAKFGYTFTPLFFAGVDLSYGMLTDSSENPTQTDTDVTSMGMGVVAGLDLMVLRTWVGYYFSRSLDYDVTGDLKATGSAFKIGVGYKVIPMVSLNLEYIISNFDEAKTNTQTSAIDTDTSSVLLSVSVPLSI